MTFSWLRHIFRNPECALRADGKIRSLPSPLSAEQHKDEGNRLFRQHRIDEALACYRRALAIAPDYGDAQWNVAMSSLFLGDYTTGFEYFERRFVAGDKAHAAHLQNVLAMMSGKPRWGGEALEGQRLLVWTEQGCGDTLMMLRFLPSIRDKGHCRLMVACEPELVRIVQGLPGVDEVVGKDVALPLDRFDLHCSLLSLPHILGTTLATLPRTVPYVSIPPGLRQQWSGRLAELDGLRVGLTWAGGKQLAQDSLRSLALPELAPLVALTDVTFVSLQKGEPANQLQELQWPIVDWMEECHDFLDTAALIDGLDLVISVDTSVAHLAGALGKPVWLLNRFESEWRWMLEREDSPWYPTMRIFRQPAPHDWRSTIRRVEADLRTLMEQRRTA